MPIQHRIGVQVLVLVFLGLMMVTPEPGFSQVQSYNRTRIRNQLLNLFNSPPQSRTVLRGELPESGAKRDFVNFYMEKIEPKFQEISDLTLRYKAMMLLRDTASYRDRLEDEFWNVVQQQVIDKYSQFTVDEEVTELLKKWSELAGDQTGELPDLARRLYKERQLESFPKEFQPYLTDSTVLQNDFQTAIMKSPEAERNQQFISRLLEIRRNLKTGVMTFADALKANEEIYAKSGPHFVAFDAVKKEGEKLNQVAVMRSHLAKVKGFDTWAEYQLKSSEDGYAENYRKTDQQRQFLKDFLAGLTPLLHTYIVQRISELGVEQHRSRLNLQTLGLISAPGLEMLQPYLPNNRITSTWQDVLLESGFQRETLAQIIVDDQLRAKKNTSNAYKMGVLQPGPKESILDVVSLNFVQPRPDQPDWKPGLIYILQSYKGLGIGDWSTAFHEGGHALEALLKNKFVDAPEAYGTVEIHSMSMERFTTDPEVIWHNLTPVDGKKPTREEIQALVDSSEKKEIISLLSMASHALFDLDLWDYDYSEPGAKTFLERVKELSDREDAESWGLSNIASDVPLYYDNLYSSHFFSGSVRHIGYVFAEISSRLVSRSIYDKIEKLSGRRTWYKQPLLASIFIDNLFTQAWKKPFPSNVEEITGQSFDPKLVIQELQELLSLSSQVNISDCQSNLQTKITWSQ